MRMTLAIATALIAAAEQSAGHGNLAAKSGGIGDIILQALNQVRDTKINPAIAQNMPDPLDVTVGKSGGADAGCIIPSPFGCICHASADYSVSLQDVQGLKGVRVTNFTTASVSADMTSITIGADMADSDVEADGGADASVSACGISPSASGSASTHARITKFHFTAAATGKLDAAHKCINISFTKVAVDLEQVSIHDTSVTIDLGPIPGVDIGKLVDLVTGLAPELTTDIGNAVEGPISKAIMHAADSGDIPCIKIPLQSNPSSEDALLV